jgi:hypothetical protein
MPSPLSEKQIREVGSWVATYIAEQRAASQEKAVPIPSEYVRELRSFFPVDVLDGVRVVRGRARKPRFYSQLRALGIRNLPPFSDMAGVTFEDIVVHVQALTRPLLFHELVHAVQYKFLGLQDFAERYVQGFLTGGSYEKIPLEKQAYELEERYCAHPETAFSVAADVENRIRLGLL